MNPMAQKLLGMTEKMPRVRYNWDLSYKKRPGFAEGRRQYGRGATQTLGGLAGLLLGPGSRDRAADDLMRLWRPAERAMDWLGYSPYGDASKRLRRAAQLTYGGKLPEGYYDTLHRQLLRGPFESRRGVLSRHSGGLKFPQRVKAYQQAAAGGALQSAHSGMSRSELQGAMKENLARVSNLMRAAQALREVEGGDIRGNVRKITESGLLDKYPAHYLPALIRQQQIRKMLRS